MTQVKSFNRPTVRQINASIEAALAQVADQYGISISVNGCRFSESEMKPRITVNTIGENGAQTAEARNFDLYKASYGLEDANIGDTFTSQGRTFKITGCKPSRRKYPISGTCTQTGRSFKFPAASVKLALSK